MGDGDSPRESVKRYQQVADLLGGIVMVGIITSLVRGNSARSIMAMGNAFSNSIRAATGDAGYNVATGNYEQTIPYEQRRREAELYAQQDWIRGQLGEGIESTPEKVNKYQERIQSRLTTWAPCTGVSGPAIKED